MKALSHDDELLQRKNGVYEYHIPSAPSEKLRVINSAAALTQGHEEITVGELQDVNERDEGLLVFEDGKPDPVYLWDQVREIDFQITVIIAGKNRLRSPYFPPTKQARLPVLFPARFPLI